MTDHDRRHLHDDRHLHDPRHLGLSRRTAGRTMVVIAWVGVVSALVGAVVGWRFLGELSDANKQALVLAEESLIAADASLVVAEDVVDSIDEALNAVGSTIRAVRGSVGDSATVAKSTARLAGELPATIDGIDDGLSSISGVADTVDSTLRQLSRVPFGPDYDPEVSFGEAISNLRAELGPLSDNLSVFSAELATLAGGSDDLDTELDGLVASVEEVQSAVGGTNQVIQRARRSTADALALSQSTLEQIGANLALTRLFLVVIAFAIAIGQIVPYWVGRELLGDDAAAAEPNVVDHD